MNGISEDGRSLGDATGRWYPIRGLVTKLADTTVRTIGLVGLLYAIGLAWELLR